MNSSTIQIIIALILISVGFIAGAAIALLLGGQRKPASRGRKLAAQSAQKPVSLPQTPPPSPATPEIELVRLWRETPGGGLKVNLQGGEITAPAALKPEEREAMSNLVREWLIWMGVPMGTATRVAAASSNPSAVQPPQPIQVPAESATVNVPLPDDTVLVAPTRPVVITPPAIPIMRAKSMLEQIDEILQEQLAASGQTARGIRLSEDVNIGIIVWVGSEHFVGIEGCPYEDVKQSIKQAAAEWERRSGQK